MALEIPSLGRPFSLGMLYDCCEEKLIPGITLWNREDLANNISTTPQNNTYFEVLTADTVPDKLSALNVSGELKISLWSGMVEVGGSGKYLTDTKESKNLARVTLKYLRSTKFDQLSMDHLCQKNITHKDVLDKGMATHVVTGILYGAQAFFIFDQKVSTSEAAKVQGQLKAMVMNLAGTLTVQKDTERKHCQFNCTFHGDFALEKNPVNYEEAMKILSSLPKLIGEDGEKAVPMKVWLHPLKNLDHRAARMVRKISDHLVTLAENTMQQMSEVVTECNDLTRHPAAITFPALGNKIGQFKKLFEHFRLTFQKQLSHVLPSVRCGKMKESTLENILTRKEKSPFRDQDIGKFLSRRRLEMEVVQSSLKQLTNFRVVSEESERIKAILDPDFDHTVCFNFSSLASEASYLSHLESWLHKETWDLQDSVSEGETKQWFEQNWIQKQIIQLVQEFQALAKEPRANSLVTSVACSDSPGITIHYYKSGEMVTTKCLPPAKPNAARITERSPDTMELVLQPAEYGRESIGSYKVEYKCTDGKEWSTLTTSSNEETVRVSGLKKNSSYRFRYSAVCKAGLSEVSEVTEAKTTKKKAKKTTK